MKREQKNRKGFTLVELLVVILIISMLAAFVAPNVFRAGDKAKWDLAKPKMAILETNLERFYIDCGRFPDDSEGLEALLYSPSDVENVWNGPYLKKDNLYDPWKNLYIYVTEPGGYYLISYGADGMQGGEGYNADIYNYD
jgi:general secretion pathway protein G